jgi:hypothetical protein
MIYTIAIQNIIYRHKNGATTVFTADMYRAIRVYYYISIVLVVCRFGGGGGNQEHLYCNNHSRDILMDII